MFEKGTVQKVMILVTLIMAGVLVGLALQPTRAAIVTALVIVALILVASGYLSLTRLDIDAHTRGMNEGGPKQTVA